MRDFFFFLLYLRKIELETMNIAHYLDATYLKTAEQAGITLEETKQNVTTLVKEAILNDFKLVMIRAEYVSHAKKLIRDANSNVLVGTVVGFYEGTTPVDEKIEEATKRLTPSIPIKKVSLLYMQYFLNFIL